MTDTKRIVKTTSRSKFQNISFGHNDAGMTFESYLLVLADRHSKDYDGGYWEMCQIDDAPFMYPSEDKEFEVSNPDNYFSDTMSNEAFGMAMSIMAMWRLVNQTQCHKLLKTYEAMLKVSYKHKESRKLSSFLD